MMSFFSFTDWHMKFIGILANRIFIRMLSRSSLKISRTIILQMMTLYQAKGSNWSNTCRSWLIWFFFLHRSWWPLFWYCLIFFIHILWFLRLFLLSMLLHSDSNNFITITSKYIEFTLRNSILFLQPFFLYKNLTRLNIFLKFVYLWKN
jgi:hypothetical protein